ncbi:DUF4331 family protein [Yinghuangia sp. YIM S10712]|uniref:DUF4331 family protein n=1 Tax=Yinghuangia sp. YIM S10712 TaxID=3436930 RepID=UPI003F534F98
MEGTVVTAVRTAIAEGRPVRLEDFDPADATNIFAGTDVNAIVLEIADTVMPAPLIGFWAATVLPTDAGGRRQINRCAQPLVNTLFALEDAERDVDFNATQPREDRERYGDVVVRDTTAVVTAMGTIPDPKAHAEALRDTLFPDVLWYEVGTEAHFATARRNGRGLTTNTPEVMFELVLGTPVSLGLDATAAGPCRPEFPYVPKPTTKPA